MAKPTAKQRRDILDYHEMIQWLEKKYNFESRGFTGIPSTMSEFDRLRNQNFPYMDFWHYLVEVWVEW